MPEIDDRDRAIIADCEAAFNQDQSLRVGDWIDFANGVSRRVSYLWPEDDDSPRGVQTSTPGSGFYLGNGYVSMGNGSLFVSVASRNLTLTDEMRPGSVWMFHHGYATAHNGVYFAIDFRVYTSTDDAPTC